MSKPIITVENLSKAYFLGHQLDRHKTFRDAITQLAKAPLRRLRERTGPSRDSADAFWALRDVNFEVQKGEVLGLVGRNGAGKSTLLKVLSRITEPTEGRAVLRGRVASLLEVGTGFHPELSGRENIFLNGSILGMKHSEIKSKFDQIVAFSEIEQFLDTPVKRYSSGMYVRLAFAVAAHLEPEILIVDEVLAVGDARFQKRCLGKMKEVSSGEGRTVLLVSHNMQAVSTLTTRCVMLKQGHVESVGPTAEILNQYIREGGGAADLIYTAPASDEKPKITRVELRTSEPHNVQANGKPMQVLIEITTPRAIESARLSFHACNALGDSVIHFWAHDDEREMCRTPGTYRLVFDVPKLRLFMGNYTLRMNLKEFAGGKEFDAVESICPFEVVMYGQERQGGWFRGSCTYLEESSWDVQKVAETRTDHFMRVVYANAKYEHHSAEGGQAHMRQFIENAAALGHELFLWHGVQPHPLTKPVPTGRLERFRFLRTVDLIYYRVEWKPPTGTKVILPPYRKFIGSPLVVWEFNTVPEYGRVQNVPEHIIESGKAEMRRLAPGVDLAVCVSKAIETYVKETLGFRQTMVTPNGSDPQLFGPDVPKVARIEQSPDVLNVVWIGTAKLGWHNFDLLRDAAASIWKSGEGHRIVFHVIGPGMERMREAPPNLNYHGSELYTQLPGWLSAMDVGLNVYRPGPSDFSSPLKVFDYMASGLTVVSTEQPQVREIFTQLNQTDLLVSSDQPEALANVLRVLAADRDRVKKQGAAGRELVINQYNWRKGVTDTFARIESLRR